MRVSEVTSRNVVTAKVEDSFVEAMSRMSVKRVSKSSIRAQSGGRRGMTVKKRWWGVWRLKRS